MATDEEARAAVYLLKRVREDPIARARMSLILQAYDAAVAKARGEG
jgi:hypothetical protein